MINHIWIIKNSGENLFYKEFGKNFQLGEDLISGFFIALDNFAKGSGKGTIDSIILKNAKFIYMNFGFIYIVVGCERADQTKDMKDIMNSIGNRFLEEFGTLEDWDGNIKMFTSFAEILDTEFDFKELTVKQLSRKFKIEVKEVNKSKKKIMFKTVLVGNARVGKTSILAKFAKNKFLSDYTPTLGVDIIRYSYDYDPDTNFTFTAWDVSGQKSFKQLRKVYYPNTESFVLIYDITNLDSFVNVNVWIEEIKQFGKKDGIFLLVGNKKDLERQRLVSFEEGKKMAKDNGYEFFETSAKTGENVKKLFDHLGKRIIERRIVKK